METALIALASGLEAGKVQDATLVVDAASITVHTTGEYGCRTYPWRDVADKARAQAAYHRVEARWAPWLAPGALRRWSVLLRLTGQSLDERGVRIGATIAPALAIHDCTVEVSVHGELVLDTRALQFHLLRLRASATDARSRRSPRARWDLWRRP